MGSLEDLSVIRHMLSHAKYVGIKIFPETDKADIRDLDDANVTSSTINLLDRDGDILAVCWYDIDGRIEFLPYQNYMKVRN